MEIIPAIDLYAGQCVRLIQGDFSQITEYGAPLTVAQNYAAHGARSLHVVDLEGAKHGQPQQLNLILQLLQASGLRVQLGGGIRSIETATHLLTLGIQRIVIGSMACHEVANTQALLTQHGSEKIILALDVMIDQEPYVTTHGWQNSTKKTLWDVLNDYREYAPLTVLCTDVAKDGLLNGPNFSLYRQAVARYPDVNWIASGGVSTLAELRELQSCGVTAVVVGKALYAKHFTLQEAIEYVK